MNTKLTVAALAALLIAATSNVPTQAQGNGGVIDPMAQPEICLVDDAYVHPNWQVEFCTLPRLLRMHLPLLPPEQGMLVSRIQRKGSAAMLYDLRSGDVLLAVDGVDIDGMESLPDSPGGNLTLLRGGEVRTLVPRTASHVDPTHHPPRLRRNQGFSFGAPFGASASAFSSNNEAVSVVQNGTEITLEMSLPELESTPIRFQGTREQIERDVESSKLSTATKQRVLQAIR